MAQRKELRGGIGCFCKGNSGGGPMAVVLAQSFSAQVADVAAALHRMRLCAEVRALVSRNPAGAAKHVAAEAPRAAS